MSALAYRPEIDGLRAVAVVPVVLYHAGVSAFSGGFAGVDVFFVISGYLITAIILRALDEGSFSLAGFWKRRAKRILPALFVMLACTLPFAWAWMLPEALHGYGGSLGAAVLFSANLWFWRTMGYFAPNAEVQPLIHTWSLGVEEQFYLLFPIAMVIAFRLGRRAALAGIVAAMLASFALCEWAAYYNRNAGFFLLPMRAWELLAGSLCAFVGTLPARRWHGAAGALGLALVLAGFFYLDQSQPFPSHFALIPVAGSVLVILFADARRGAGLVLAARPLVAVGLVSYSLYLWHQPLFAFARLRSAYPPSGWELAALAVLACGLAWLSWRFVEQPFRRRDYSPRKARVALAGGAVLLSAIGAVTLYAMATDGIRGRLQPSRDPQVLTFLARADPVPEFPAACETQMAGKRAHACWVVGGPHSARRIAVFGDSHAAVFAEVLSQLARERGFALYFATSGGCPPLQDVFVIARNAEQPGCRAMADHQLASVRRHGFEGVFLIARWTLYSHGQGTTGDNAFLARKEWALWPTLAGSREALAHGLRQTVAAYREAGAWVVLANQAPQQDIDARREAGWLRFSAPEENFDASLRARSVERAGDDALHAFSLGQLRALESEFESEGVGAGGTVEVLDFNSLFADGDRYLWASPQGPWYYDDDHLNRRGALRVRPAFEQALAARGL